MTATGSSDEEWVIIPAPNPSTSPPPPSLVPPPPPPPASSSSRFPTTLSDLQLPTANPAHTSLYKSLKALRKSTLSIHNRLTSITSDSVFVQAVAAHYRLPLVANERCGSWYIPTQAKVGSAYFKSTDGHHGQWAFSSRRLNLALLRLLGEKRGAVLVDSTRRGKSVSDALAKTVPGWVCVLNRVLFPEHQRCRGLRVWDGVGESEKSQIEARVETWCAQFKGLGLDLEGLRKEVKRPLRVVWAVNGEWEAQAQQEDGVGNSDCNLLVLCSASRRVRGAEASEGGYVQGSGDDHEGWSLGLTPDVFWKYQDLLLSTGEEELPELVGRLMGEKEGVQEGSDAVCVEAVGTIWIGRGCRRADDVWDLVINCQGNSGVSSARTMDLNCRQLKLGSKDLRGKLPAVRSFVTAALERKQDCRILITCDSGKDLSVGVALAVLCLYYGDDGNLWTIPARMRVIDKHLVKKRLAWIMSSKSDANPSRATLQAVNSFLMDRPG